MAVSYNQSVTVRCLSMKVRPIQFNIKFVSSKLLEPHGGAFLEAPCVDVHLIAICRIIIQHSQVHSVGHKQPEFIQ